MVYEASMSGTNGVMRTGMLHGAQFVVLDRMWKFRGLMVCNTIGGLAEPLVHAAQGRAFHSAGLIGGTSAAVSASPGLLH